MPFYPGAEAQTGRHVTVTLNEQHTAHRYKIKELLDNDLIGDIHSIDFHWYLDTVHGADYFRRWHRKKRNSGGLLVHKATHHFDLANWWLGSQPKHVMARGSKRFYDGRQQSGHGIRCKECDVSCGCAFYLDVTENEYSRMYTAHEQHDGYFRDQCVFSDDTDIEDTMSVLVRYENGVQMTYSLTSFAPFEGWRIAFNGTKGRLEAFEPESAVLEGESKELVHRAGALRRVNWESAVTSEEHVQEIKAYTIRFYPTFGGIQTFEIPVEDGTHGGADTRMRDLLFGVTEDCMVTGSHDG